MKIGVFTDTYYPDISGVTVSIENFVSMFRKKGNKVYIFAPKVKGYKDKDTDVYRVTSLKLISSEPEVRLPLLLPYKTLQKMFSLDLDLIHAHGNGPFSLLGYQMARIKNIPYILTFHTIHTKYTHYFFDGKIISPKMVAGGLRVFANLCDGVVVPSEKMKEELTSYGFRGQVKVIPSFINLKKFESLEKGYLHKKLNIPEGSPILISVGRLGKEKNFNFLIKAFKKVTKINSNAYLVIVGQGPEKNNLKKLTKSLGIEKRVHLTGKLAIKTMPLAYVDADIFVFASDTETQGICVLEAAASGLPLVVVEDPAFKNAVIDGVNGFATLLDEKIFAQKIALLLRDISLRNKLGENSKKIANENFKPEKLALEMLSFYKEIIKKHKTKKRILRRIINKASFINFLKIAERVNKLLGSTRW
ncbi:MAG: hypothetical protein A2172_05180 [Candidatus Woykebacteria bacterium RBG_13_40_15]|uniref:Glycosyl transferase family 1 n=1 Tax=Candidatus Woykebacteria bacterium RBG_13_40_15 TaxID=1802593 RepID=A0A1G1W969_9BACT|nr:MAG: hypothetical protein A2172_05180 [Candidatus Woykebacteria bacterium RBG_13_40_15]